MNVFKQITRIIFVPSLVIMLFTASVSISANSAWLYEWGFRKYNISNELGISTTDLHRVAHGLIGYWNNGEKFFNITVVKDGTQITLFNQKEVQHLADVKDLFRFLYQCLLGSFIYVLAFVLTALFWWKDKKLLGVGLMWGSGFSILLMIILGIMAITDFHWLFWQFHLLAFVNNLWLLDPKVDYLVVLFPDGFWFDAAMIFTALKIFLALIAGFIGWRMLKPKTGNPSAK